MQLFVHITNHPESASPIMTRLMDAGIHGATMVDCKGMLSAVSQSDFDEAPPIFGSIRRYLNPENPSGKMIFIVLKDEDVPVVKEIVHTVSGDLNLPNTGILFTVPIMNWEGVSHR